jgi:hypothetical protein
MLIQCIDLCMEICTINEIQMYSLSTRPFALELETSTPIEVMMQITPGVLLASGIAKEKILCTQAVDKTKSKDIWHLKMDTSTESELATPVHTLNELPLTLRVAEGFKAHGVETTMADGLHIHVDIPDINRRYVEAMWCKWERVILQFFPKSRSEKATCSKCLDKKAHSRKGKVVTNHVLDNEANLNGRTGILSFSYYQKRKSVEFRLGDGSVEPTHIKNFVLFVLHLVEYAKSLTTEEIIETLCSPAEKTIPGYKVSQTLTQWKIKDKALRKYLTARFNHFNYSKYLTSRLPPIL